MKKFWAFVILIAGFNPMWICADVLRTHDPITNFTLTTDTSSPLLSQPTFEGTGRSASTVAVVIDGNLNGVSHVDFSGTWRYQVSGTLTDGQHTLQLSSLDLEGNVSPMISTIFSIFTPIHMNSFPPPWGNPLRLYLAERMKIRFQLSRAQSVTIKVYDLTGTERKTISVDALKPAGWSLVIWDGKDNFGNSLESGVYHIHLKTEEFDSTRSVTVLQ